MTLSTQPYKGARDFYPEDKRLQKYMFATLRSVAERYGYEEYDAPILEPLEIYLAKSGQEIVTEQTYVFEDRGGRKVVIRPEMTPTVSRMVAGKRQSLVYPVRWYSIPNLWRYERPQRGRLREHWQLNVDIFGVSSSSAEIEIISLVDDVFKQFGANSSMYHITLNDRQLVNYILRDYLALDEQSAYAVSKLIDRINKLERSAFLAQLDDILTSEQKEQGVSEKLLTILDAKKLSDLPKIVTESGLTDALDATLAALRAAGISNVSYDPTLMRGFDYYTGVVFEVFDTDPENNRAMLGGGRYDGLVGLFGVDPVPTVGFGWGDVTLSQFLISHNLVPDLKPEVDIVVVSTGDIQTKVAAIATQLRKQELNVAVDLSGKKLGDQLKNVEKRGVEWALVIGESEITSGELTLKYLPEHREIKVAVTDVKSAIRPSK